ncbi:MAG: hypothetical protein M3O46_12320 [Myxococcota bacterium]|nr:hypothetical protein [Myxococcota bacterium]
MTRQRLLSELETLATRLGIVVRVESFGGGALEGRGGLCWVHGKPAVMMDASLSVPERIATLTAALAKFDMGGVYVPPLVRACIEGQIPNRSRFARTNST